MKISFQIPNILLAAFFICLFEGKSAGHAEKSNPPLLPAETRENIYLNHLVQLRYKYIDDESKGNAFALDSKIFAINKARTVNSWRSFGWANGNRRGTFIVTTQITPGPCCRREGLPRMANGISREINITIGRPPTRL